MAKLDQTFAGDFDTVLSRLESAVLEGSVSSSLEDSADYTIGTVRVAIRMFERYSYIGGNRVAMCVTLTGDDGGLHLTAITAGGSQAMFFKLNTFGEEAFLDTIADLVNSL